MKKLVLPLIALYTCLLASPSVAAIGTDKRLIEKDTAAWLKANSASKDHAMTAVMVVFIQRGLWKAPGKGPTTMSRHKASLIACVDSGAAAIRSKKAKPIPVAEAAFACGHHKGFLKKK